MKYDKDDINRVSCMEIAIHEQQRKTGKDACLEVLD